MARTIKTIQEAIVASVSAAIPGLSPSAVAEWRLWTHIVAEAVHSFEVILDLFRAEMDALTDKVTPGTRRWYAEMCRRYQMGHKLAFDDKTAMLYYPVDDPAARIIKMVAVTEAPGALSIKIAKTNSKGQVEPLSAVELMDFTGYIDAVKFAGLRTTIISTAPDKIRYAMDVYYDTIVPSSTVHVNVVAALDSFKASLGFDSVIYSQRMVDAVMAAEGVVTVELKEMARQGASAAQYTPVGVYAELDAGYFDYDPASVVTLTTRQEQDTTN